MVDDSMTKSFISTTAEQARGQKVLKYAKIAKKPKRDEAR